MCRGIFAAGFGCTTTHDVQLAKHKSFAFKLERQLKQFPNALRIVHGQLWVCFYDGVAIHSEGELSLLQEQQLVYLSYSDPSGYMTQLTDIYDVAGTLNNQFAVAAVTGLFIFEKSDKDKPSCKC